MVVFAALVLAFLGPGYVWVSWLHSGDELDLPTKVALGWAWSFAIFSIVAGPFLALHGGVTTFLTVAGCVWVALVVGAGLFFARSRKLGNKGAERTAAAKRIRQLSPRAEQVTRRAGPLAVFVLTAILAGLVVERWVNGGTSGHQSLTMIVPAVLLAAAFVARVLKRTAEPMLRFGPNDATAPPRLWSLLAGLLILFQAAGVVAYGRPDWDDCFYLAASLDYQQGQTLNDQEPTHREGFPMPAIYQLLTWELWGATLGRLAGLGPLVVFHTALPGMLVLASYAAYRAVLGELLPRRWVPLALLGLCGYYLWGISSFGNASNQFLIRIWQGKSVMLHLEFPLATIALIRFVRLPGFRWWLTLVACLAIGPGLSSSAVSLSVCLVFCLVPLLLPIAPAGRRIVAAAGPALALIPTLGVGVLLWLAIRGEPVYQSESTLPSWQEWMRQWNRYAGIGSAELAWLAFLPLLWVLLGEWRSRAYLVGLPAVMFLTFGNPFLESVVAGRVTSAVTYDRLFWLYPVGPGLAVLLALSARLLSKLLGASNGPKGDWLPLGFCALILAVTATLPGMYAWGEANSLGSFMKPVAADNLEKMPAELKVVARRLLEEPDLDQSRIVCGEEVASFLTPFHRNFRFVRTRANYTMYYVARSQSPAAAAERVYLPDALRLGPGFPRLPENPWEYILRASGPGADSSRPDPWPSLENLPRLLDRYDVSYAIASPAVGDDLEQTRTLTRIRDWMLDKCEFRRIYQGQLYSLWKRERPASSVGGSRVPIEGTSTPEASDANQTGNRGKSR